MNLHHTTHYVRFLMIRVCLLFILVLGSFKIFAIEYAGAQMTYECIGPDFFLVTLSLTTDCASDDPGDVMYAKFFEGCSSTLSKVRMERQSTSEISQLCPTAAESDCNGGPNSGRKRHVYTTNVILTTYCSNPWKMTWHGQGRNSSVNISASSIVAEAELKVNICNSSPIFNEPSLIYTCKDELTNFNFSASEKDQDNLAYSLVAPMTYANNRVGNASFTSGYSVSRPINGLTLDVNTGQVQFTANELGNFALAVKITETDPVTGKFKGSVIRESQVVVLDCSNKNPELDNLVGIINFTGDGTLVSDEKITACEGDHLIFDIVFSDPNGGDVVSLSTDLLELFPLATIVTTTGNPAKISIDLIVPSGLNSIQNFSVNANDDACPLMGSTSEGFMIDVEPKPIVSAYQSRTQQTCGFQSSITLTGKSTQANGGIIWSTNGTGSFGTSVYNLNNAYLPSVADRTLGTVDIYLTTTGSKFCAEVSDTLTIQLMDFNPNLDPIIVSSSLPICFGESNGTAEVSWAPMAYEKARVEWNTDPIQTTKKAINLAAGSYKATVISTTGCSVASLTIRDPREIDPGINIHSPNKCYNGSNASATAYASGGTGKLHYLWDERLSNSTNPNVFNVFAGTYFVTVTDANACFEEEGMIVTQPEQVIFIQSTPTDVSCFGERDGEISVVATGGNPGYRYQWNPSNIGVPDIENLPPSRHDVTVTDRNGNCTVDTGIVVVEPDPISISTTVNNPNCGGGNDGSATIHALGGVGPYSYLWDVNALLQTDSTAINLTAGRYQFTVTDANGCHQVSSVTLSEPQVTIKIATSSNPITCFGYFDGSAQVTVTGAVPPIDYVWSGSANGQTTNVVTGLSAGSYDVTITDDNGCQAQSTVIVDGPASPINLDPTSSGISCKGVADGKAIITASGGLAPYQYVWDGYTDTDNTLDFVAQGSYDVSVTDSYGCEATATVVVTEPTQLTATSHVPDEVKCKGGSDGIGTVVPAGGTSPYNYQWPISAGAQTSNSANGLSEGTYVVTITDDNTCAITHVVTMTEPAFEITAIVSSVDPVCFGDKSGTASVVASGGTPAYTYQWQADLVPNTTGDEVTMVPSGSYSVTVVDSRACPVIVDFVLTDPLELTSTISSVRVSCFGDFDGTAQVDVVNAASPITYNWSGAGSGQNTALVVGLPVGTYTVTATDNNLCEVINTVDVNGPPSALSVTGSSTLVSCNGSSDGSVTVSASGGTPTYKYVWSGYADTDKKLDFIVAGDYTVTVDDAYGCSESITIKVSEPDVLVLTEKTNEAVGCKGDDNGSSSLLATGGIGPYDYQWPITAGSVTTAAVKNLSEGTYVVTVTDFNGCADQITVVITEPDFEITNKVETVDAVCFGQNSGIATAKPSGGTPPYVYQWPASLVPSGNGESVTMVSAGTYTMTVADDNLCFVVTSFTVNNSIEITSTISSTRITCFNGTDGTATVVVVNATPPLTYTWSGAASGQNSDMVTALPAGKYSVTVSDDNGCEVENDVTVIGPDSELVATGSSIGVTCNGGTDGVVEVSVTGGASPYRYAWDGYTDTDTKLEFLPIGTYTVTITDSFGCTTSTDITVTQPSPLSITEKSNTEVDCHGGNTGSASVSVTGGVSPYSYQWPISAGGSNTASANNLSENSYVVTVTDFNQCSDVITIIITEPASPVTNRVETVDATCSGTSTGSAKAIASGGSSPYNYQWSVSLVPSVTGESVSMVPAGSYSVTVTDSHTCSAISNFTVGDPVAMTTSISSTPVTCFGGSDGTAEVLVTNGTTPLKFKWSGAASNQSTSKITGLPVGDYTVTVIDSKLCEADNSVKIIGPPSALVASGSSVNVNCNGGSDGQAKVTVTGGISPYDYAWTGYGDTDDKLENISAGVYTVVITDSYGCTTSENISISEPIALSIIELSNTEVNCKGGSDGTASVYVSGGTKSYIYSWPTGAGGVNTKSASNLSQGTYVVTVTDAKGCTGTQSVTIIEPLEALSNVVTPSGAACNGTSSGKALSIPSGGTAPYNYQWSSGLIPNALGNEVSKVPPGHYAMTVTDSRGCHVISNFEVIDALPITLRMSLRKYLVMVDPMVRQL